MKITKFEIQLLVEQAKDELNKECPSSTQDISLNTAHRDRAIQADFIKYGPLNVEEPGDFWEKIADKWDTDVEAAKKSKCANCVAFDISPRMLECIPGKTSEPVEDEFGKLGYCWMHHFKCHSARSCNTWAAGGPINEDEVSYDWQKRNLKQAIDPEPIDPDMYQDDTEGEEKKLTYNDFVRMVRDDMMTGAAPDEKPSDKQVASRAKSLYNDYLQGASVDDLFEAKYVRESLRNWFKKEDWVRIDTQGNITGACGTMKKGKKTTRCLPRKKAQSLTKKQRAATARKKARSKKQFVKNTKAAKVSFKKKKK